MNLISIVQLSIDIVSVFPFGFLFVLFLFRFALLLLWHRNCHDMIVWHFETSSIRFFFLNRFSFTMCLPPPPPPAYVYNTYIIQFIESQPYPPKSKWKDFCDSFHFQRFQFFLFLSVKRLPFKTNDFDWN